MAKLELNDIGTLANPASARQALNDNFKKIEDEFEKVVYRDGSTPNSMGADLDMDSHRVLNVADAVHDKDAVNKGQVEDIAYEAAEVLWQPRFDDLVNHVEDELSRALKLDGTGTYNANGNRLRGLPYASATDDAATLGQVMDQIQTAISNPNAELFLQNGDDAVPRTVADKLRDVVSVKDFGAVGDGVTDDTAAIQNAIDSGADSIFLPPGTYCVKSLRITGRNGVRGYRFFGAGNTSIIKIIGTDADAYSVTEGTSTLSANLYFHGGGEGRPYVGDFMIEGNPDVSYGVLIRRFFNGSFFGNVTARNFSKPGAVPFTYMNCVSTHSPNLTAKNCSRFIRLHGMADAVKFIKPTVYDCDADTYSQIFNEAGWLSSSDPDRYTVGTIIEEPYCHRNTSSSNATVPSTFIHLTNASKCHISDVWPEGIQTSIRLTGCEKTVIQNALSSVSTTGSSRIVVEGGYNNFIDTEGGVHLGDTIENTVISRSNIALSVFNQNPAGKNIIIAKDKVFLGKEMLTLGVSYPESYSGVTPSAAPSSHVLHRYQEGSFTPTLKGSISDPSVTYTYNTGTYQIVGNILFFYISLRVGSISGGSGDLRIAGLPYENRGTSISGGMGEVSNWASNPPDSYQVPGGGNSYLTTQYEWHTNQVSDVQANTVIRVSGFYFLT